MTELSLRTPSAPQNTAAAVEKPPLGGWYPGARLDPDCARTLDAVIDTLIPGGDDFPAPSEVGVRRFIERYVTPPGQPEIWYPFLPERELMAWLDTLDGFVDSALDKRMRTLSQLEYNEPGFFARLRDLVYQAYYSRPEVVRAINTLPAGKDYRVSPQPYGYAEVIDDWDEALLARVTGSYTRTEDIVRVPLPDGLAGPDEKAPADRNGPSHRAGPVPPEDGPQRPDGGTVQSASDTVAIHEEET